MNGQDDILNPISKHFDPAHYSIEPEALKFYGKDWTTAYTANPSVIVFPDSIEQIECLIRLAKEHDFKLVPSGGRTGYSGAAVATAHEVVVSLEKMNRITDIDTTDQLLYCNAGCPLQKVQEAANAQGLFYPIDIASKGSCQIGGNISTNAGGNRVIRYGMTRNWVAGMTVTTGNAETLKLNRALIKDNSGYDLRQPFIGAEGTLGIISQAILRLTTPPINPQVMLLAIDSIDNACEILVAFRQKTALLAVEFFDHTALERVIQKHRVTAPFDTPSNFYLLLEYENSSSEAENNALQLFENCFNKNWISDGMISQNESQRSQFWHYREYISESLIDALPFKCDLSIQPSRLAACAQAVEKTLATDFSGYTGVWFGHIGDGNIHLNILKPDDTDELTHHNNFPHLAKKIYPIVNEFQGSIAAEHGVGLLKKAYLPLVKSSTELHYYRSIKDIFDPKQLLNPGKIIE